MVGFLNQMWRQRDMILNAQKNFVGQATQSLNVLIEEKRDVSNLKFHRIDILKAAVPKADAAKILLAI